MKRIIIGAAVFTGLAALGAAGAACTAAPAPAAQNRVQVLRLHTRDISDAGHDNVFTVVYDLRPRPAPRRARPTSRARKSRRR